MKILIGFFSLALLLANQCGTEADFSIGEPFVLAPGQTYQNDKLSVADLQIIEDSRCPKGTTCVWQGQVVVSFLVNGEKMELTLQSGDPSLAVGEYAAYRFVAQQLTPYPAGEQQIAPDTYRLTLLIQQQP